MLTGVFVFDNLISRYQVSGPPKGNKMLNLETHKLNITESTAMNLIFDACRANERREPRNVGDYRVTFGLRADGTHDVIMRNAKGVVVATAVVDEFDC